MSTTLGVVIIDDETPAVNILKRFVEKVSFLELICATTDAFEGLNILNSQQVDLLFIDIEMPDITGVEFVKSLKMKPIVVFTTAYREYALEGFELDVIDYLLKPIRFERFLKAVNKAHQFHQFMNPVKEEVVKDEALLIKVDYKTVRLKFDDIDYIEGCKDYVKIFTTDGMVLTRLNLKNIQSRLPVHEFIRIHRSYIVAFSKIRSFKKNEVQIGDKFIPVGEYYKETVVKRLN